MTSGRGRPAESRPNVLLVSVDQMRADHLGSAGNPVIRTPNLDRLAAEGVAFERAYVNCPLCMPSRATLFSGLSPRGHGVRTNGIPLAPSTITLPELLLRDGYRTGSIGKIHLSNYELYSQSSSPERESFPELRESWRDGSREGVPSPYFGLEHVELTIGHGAGVEGDYARWLQEEYPRQWQTLQEEGVRPSPLGAEGCGTFPLPEVFHHSAWVADRTIDYLERHERGQPFFLMCSFPDPHHPYEVPEPWDRMYEPEQVVPPVARPGEFDDLHPLFTAIENDDVVVSGRRRATRTPERQMREILAHTYGSVSLIDKQLGKIIDALDRLELRESTIVIFLSDHGDLMGDHGLLNKGPFHFEGLLKVPMIWSWRNCFSSGRSNALVSLLDLVPTLLELTGSHYPNEAAVAAQLPTLPGRSLVPVLRGTAPKVQDSVLIENDEDYLGLRLRTVVTERYKLTTYTGEQGPEPWGELFDLANDPAELQNLWTEPGMVALRNELLAELHHSLVRTDPVTPRRVGHA